MDENRAVVREKIEKWFDANSDDMIRDLGRLIAIRSVKAAPVKGAPFGKDSREALALANSMLEERGFTVDSFEDIMISVDIGPRPPHMGILAHLDVVDEGEGWDTDPYSMVVKDDKIYGRGASDDKGPSIAAMYAMYCIRDLFPGLKKGFRLLLGSAEETGCEDIAQYLEKVAPPQYVFTPDAYYPLVNVEKGRIAAFFGASWDKEETLPRIVSMNGGKTLNVVPDYAEAIIEGFSINELNMYCMISSVQTGTKISVVACEEGLKIVAEGKSTHAATPDLGVNAQTALIDMLTSMPFADSKGLSYVRALNRLFPHGDYRGKSLGIAMDDEISGELTLNFGVIRYTETDFSGNFDARTPACADGADLIGTVATALGKEGVELTNSRISECHHTPADDAFVQTLLGIYEEYTGNPGECIIMGGQTYVHEIPGGVAFGCKLPEIDNRIHGANEFIGKDQLIVSAKMFAQAIADMCG